MSLTLYGIPNCDTVKKARVWLNQHGVDYAFHDYKKAGVDRIMVDRWADVFGWEAVLNRAGTTFRALPDPDKQDLTHDKAMELMIANPSMIKRPILEGEGVALIGFKPEAWEKALG